MEIVGAILRTNVFQPRGRRAVDADAFKSWQAFAWSPGRSPEYRSPGRSSRFGSTAAHLRGAPALRSGGARRAALERPTRRLPHRGARPGQGPGRQERRDRTGGFQGRLCGARTLSGGTGGTRRAGARLLHGVHLRSARPDGQPGRWRGGAAAGNRAMGWRRLLSRRRGGQGHRHLLGPGQLHLGAVRLLVGDASPPAVQPATTTRPWVSLPAVPGNRSSGTSARWTWTCRPSRSRSSASAT